MREKQREKVTIKVSLIVVLIDDFTDEIIQPGQARVWIDGEKKPVVKPDGYYIFTNVAFKDLTVEVENFFYQKARINIRAEEWQKQLKIYKIRLFPNEHYKLPENTTCIRGILKNSEIFQFICRENQKQLHLLRDYTSQQKNKLSIYNPLGIKLEDKGVLILSGDGTYEIFKIEEQEQNDEYRISCNLKNNYLKTEASLFVIYEIRPDAQGCFRVPLAGLEDKGGIVKYERICKGKLKEPKKILYGQVNELQE